MSENEKPNKPLPPAISVGFPRPRFDQTKRDLGIISSDADGILTRLFRNIGYDLTDNQFFSKASWRRMMDSYLNELVEADPSVNRQNERGNFTKALAAPKMSWKTFIKGLKLYRFKKFRFIIIGTHEDNTVTIHSVTAALRAGANNDPEVEALVNIIEEAVRDAIESQNNKGKQ